MEKLSDLLAMAQGGTIDANLNKIYLVREDQRININAKEIMREGQRLNDFGLSAGDQVYVARRAFSFRSASLLISGVTALVAVISLYISSR